MIKVARLSTRSSAVGIHTQTSQLINISYCPCAALASGDYLSRRFFMLLTQSIMQSFAILIAFAAAVTAKSLNLSAALAATPELSNLTDYVSLFPDLLSFLAEAQNITILAPSNGAFEEFLRSPAGSVISNNDTRSIQAILQYHVLNGTHPAAVITDTPSFIPTLLADPSYTNVTGGQVVEAIKQGEDVVFYSGLLSNATVTEAVRWLPPPTFTFPNP